MTDAPLRLGVIGLGAAARSMLPFVADHPGVRLVGGADPDEQARAALTTLTAHDTVPTHASALELIGRDDVDVIYVAGPTPLHAEHTVAALAAGKHVVVEKPMATSVEAATAMVEAAERAGRVLLVGHSQSFEAPVRAMRALVESGSVGALRAVNCSYYTDWMYRPRHPDEFDDSLGGGVPMRQCAHHADIIRFIGGGLLSSVRGTVGRWDPRRPGDGAYVSYLEFVDGTPATAVYSGYDHFPGTELTFGIGESGQSMAGGYAVARQHLRMAEEPGGELAMKRGSGGASRQEQLLTRGTSQPFFGLVVVSCERADLRVSPAGLTVYGDTERVDVSLSGWPVGRTALLDELVSVVREGARATHDGRWGRANLEVSQALVASSRNRREMRLGHQVALPAQRAQPELDIAAAKAVGGQGGRRLAARR